MLLDQMTPEAYEALHAIWDDAAERLPDEMRDPDLLDFWLFKDQGATKIYVVDETATVVVAGDLRPGLSATVMILNPEVADPGAIRRELWEVMGEFELNRLTANVPGPVKDVQRILKTVGFRREGHLRRATFWNGRLCGVDIYGMYRDRRRDPAKEEEVMESVA